VSAPHLEGPRREVLATLAVVFALVAFAASGPIARRLARHPTPERCAAMLERYAEQEARASRRTPTAQRLPLDAPDVVRCTRDLTDEEVGCALVATYVDALERCLP
jgi:hypothetical protein